MAGLDGKPATTRNPASGGKLSLLPAHCVPPHRWRSRPFQEPALEIIKQLIGLFRAEHATGRGRGYQRGHGLIDLMTLRKFSLELELSGRPDAGVDERRGIDDDDACEAAEWLAIREPETRHDRDFRTICAPGKTYQFGKCTAITILAGIWSLKSRLNT
jgi:hypothetical protein